MLEKFVLLQIYPDESHSLHGVIKHEHHTMEVLIIFFLLFLLPLLLILLLQIPEINNLSRPSLMTPLVI